MRTETIKTESTIRTEELIEPFVAIEPAWIDRDRRPWLILKIVTTQTVTQAGTDDGTWITEGEPSVEVYGRRLTKKGVCTGATHLIPWMHDRDDVDMYANVADHAALNAGVKR